MFVIKKSDSYEWPVSVEFPVSGTTKTEKFVVEFKRVSQTRTKEMLDLINNDEMTGRDLAKEVVMGWKEIVDESGNEVPFSPGAFDKLLDVVGVGNSISKAFFSSITGVKAKN